MQRCSGRSSVFREAKLFDGVEIAFIGCWRVHTVDRGVFFVHLRRRRLLQSVELLLGRRGGVRGKFDIRQSRQLRFLFLFLQSLLMVSRRVEAVLVFESLYFFPLISPRDQIFGRVVLLAARGARVRLGVHERVSRAFVAKRARALRHHDGVAE